MFRGNNLCLSLQSQNYENCGGKMQNNFNVHITRCSYTWASNEQLNNCLNTRTPVVRFVRLVGE